MTSPTLPLVTLEEFSQLANLEESPAWELLDHRIEQKTMPTIHHSRRQKKLVAVIDQANSKFEAFPELRCVLTHHSIVPDIAIIHQTRIPVQNEPIKGAPEWLIEILSPDQSTTKLIAKIQTCLNEGSQLAWLIDSQESIVMVFHPDQPLQLLRDDMPLPVLGGMDFPLTPAQIFSGLSTGP